jgi:hypothetical protein
VSRFAKMLTVSRFAKMLTVEVSTVQQQRVT